ncbi:hypothetical protein GUITHDRAFT_99686 [Guillardia theta CCMP2712]|uniref:Uncharacterized protein n=1 Tax=Guillardia theta (strain CCMP2712) TaxID=905079 RepID=L1K2I5_GUITC|nr:hypothetical protein GUITHDRAFT_99686 [Guillardia theta CCMP2712]EKX55046.1 hypothetical protein GUITHDRAFT_99686 [Guillardia theta CCMP2712]|eukprot:XP_005842026.1 hypothetical protein GUITHDRAFT_99686 [Guillardia theta CCMP2712]
MGEYDLYQRQQAWFDALEFSMSGTRMPCHKAQIRRILDLGFQVSIMQGVGRRMVAMAKVELQHASRHYDLWKELFDIITQRKRQLAATRIQAFRRGILTRRLLNKLRSGSSRHTNLKAYSRSSTSKKFSKSFVGSKGQSLADLPNSRRRKSSSQTAVSGNILGQEAKGLRKRLIHEYVPIYSLQMSQPQHQEDDEVEDVLQRTTQSAEPRKWSSTAVTLIR